MNPIVPRKTYRGFESLPLRLLPEDCTEEEARFRWPGSGVFRGIGDISGANVADLFGAEEIALTGSGLGEIWIGPEKAVAVAFGLIT